MLKATDDGAMEVQVAPAAASQRSVVANLLELYCHDFSEFLPLELGADGHFGYKELSTYWSEPSRHPLLVTVNREIAGFALVKRVGQGAESVWDMAEFFIVRAHRMRGVGMVAAHAVWSRFPGQWQVRVMPENGPALSFWQKAVNAHFGAPVQPAQVETGGRAWLVFEFASGLAGASAPW